MQTPQRGRRRHANYCVFVKLVYLYFKIQYVLPLCVHCLASFLTFKDNKCTCHIEFYLPWILHIQS
jgi:hypothetical protein